MEEGQTPPVAAEAPPTPGASSFIFPPSSQNLDWFAHRLREGAIVAIPTETVYGLAAVATNPEACRSIFAVKGRPLIDPLIVHVSGSAMASTVSDWSPAAETLAEAFWPGPLSIIVPKNSLIPLIVTAGRPTVALRAPRHHVPADLIERLGQPLAAPSANPFGYVSPSTARHVADSFGPRVPYIIDGGPCEVGLESTIVDLSQPGRITLMRPGAISGEAIADVLKCAVQAPPQQSNPSAGLIAPGLLASHYSPTTPLQLFSGRPPGNMPRQALIFLSAPPFRDRDGKTFWLSEEGHPDEIGRSLFALLRTLDQMGWEQIACELPPPESRGILLAVRDRLLRAAARPT